MSKNCVKRIMVVSLLMASLLTSNVNASDLNNVKEEVWTRIDEYVSEQYSSLSESEKKELVEEIYFEKYAVPSLSVTYETQEENLVDVAYESMLERENYIVEIVSIHSGKETSFEAWEYNLQYLKSHYKEIMEFENVNGIYVDRYIEDYEHVMATKDMPKKQINVVRTKNSSYNPDDAVTYAETYYDTGNYNPAYPDWSSYGGDCANFVSQCLYAGGKSMRGTPGTSSSATNWSNWFSTGSICNTNNVSSTWRGANAFKSYWQSNASSYCTFDYVGEESYDYGYEGDAISLLNSNGSAYHTMIIVGYDPYNHDFIMSAHTGNTFTKKLSDYNTAYGFIIYNMQ